MANQKEYFHFVGIGGVGMSGIATILLESGYKVSGSDLNESKITKRLKKLGAKVYQGHHGNNVSDEVNNLVVSTAIPKNNPEVQMAKSKGIHIIQRGEMLAKIMKDSKGIAIAGSHGKTTTSSMISLILEKSLMDPTIVVGGEISDIGGNAKLGHGEYFVAEADESDGSFLKLSPFISIVTNIEDDHLDYYGNRENILKAFKQFAKQTDEKGFAIFCIDDENIKKVIKDYNKKVLTYGVSPEADYRASDIRAEGLGTRAKIYFENQLLGDVEINVPGVHNVKNALVSIAIGHQLGLDFSAMARALKQFKGIGRRFQIIGQIGGVTVVDDYAHHPTEVAATLKAATQTDAKRVIGIFQPHRYSRTKYLYNEFGKSFADADKIIINDIYAAGEEPIKDISSKLIVEATVKAGQKSVEYLPTKKETIEYLTEEAKEGDLILTLGAGNVWQTAVELVEKLANKEATKGELRESSS